SRHRSIMPAARRAANSVATHRPRVGRALSAFTTIGALGDDRVAALHLDLEPPRLPVGRGPSQWLPARRNAFPPRTRWIPRSEAIGPPVGGDGPPSTLIRSRGPRRSVPPSRAKDPPRRSMPP